MNVLADRFSDLDDPRESGKVIYPLTDVLVIAVCAAIAGAESYWVSTVFPSFLTLNVPLTGSS
jgi:hypothetical protein